MASKQQANYLRTSRVLQSKTTSKEVILELPPPHPRQHELISIFKRFPNVRFVPAACGTKFGKTFGSSLWMAEEAWNHRGFLLWWVAPSYAQSKNAYNLLKRLLPDRTYEESKSELRLTLMEPDGSEHSVIEFKSGDNPDTLRGFAVNRFVLDEAARMPYEAFVSVMTTVTQTMGKGLIISTPKGRGWFWDVYNRGVKDHLEGAVDPWPDWMSIRLPTWTNPHVSMDAIRSFKTNMPEAVFQEEVAAEFLEESAGVFHGIANCIKGTLEPPTEGESYVLGVDLARHRDYTVLIVMKRRRTGPNQVVYVDRFVDVQWELQQRRIVEISRAYNHAIISIDASGLGDPIVENLRIYGLPVEPYKIGGNQAKTQLIERLRVAIENQKIAIPKDRKTQAVIDELGWYEYKTTETGLVRYSAPEGKHDDCVVALALANWVLDQQPFVYRYFQRRGI